MRIFVFGTRGFPGVQGGVEKHCEYLYPLLSDKFDITIFRRKPFLHAKNNDIYPSLHFIDLISTKIKGFEAFFHSFLCTIYCLYKLPDIVHIHNIGPGIFIPLLKLFGLRVVLTYHSANYEHDKWGLISKKILKASEWISTKWADRIIFVNKAKMKFFGDDVLQKSVCIPNGVHQVSRTIDIDYISRLGLKPGKYILTVGRITQEKGFDYLINAFLQNPIPSYRLVIAGGIDHTSQYTNNIYDIVQLHPDFLIAPGYVDGENLRQLYSHAALFVLPSYNEGFPLVLLEAMSYHLPVLASDISANKLLGLDDSDYFKVGDTDDLSHHLASKLKIIEPSSHIFYDIDLYGWENVAKQTANVFLYPVI
jgi:glycosyltransferase involved in cell wall biosynthesis